MIFPRKYFYPLVSAFDCGDIDNDNDLIIATNTSNNILCLPLSDKISDTKIIQIVDVIKSCLS